MTRLSTCSHGCYVVPAWASFTARRRAPAGSLLASVSRRMRCPPVRCSSRQRCSSKQSRSSRRCRPAASCPRRATSRALCSLRRAYSHRFCRWSSRLSVIAFIKSEPRRVKILSHAHNRETSLAYRVASKALVAWRSCCSPQPSSASRPASRLAHKTQITVVRHKLTRFKNE